MLTKTLQKGMPKEHAETTEDAETFNNLLRLYSMSHLKPTPLTDSTHPLAVYIKNVYSPNYLPYS